MSEKNKRKSTLEKGVPYSGPWEGCIKPAIVGLLLLAFFFAFIPLFAQAMAMIFGIFQG
jgi:hypothetical protein